MELKQATRKQAKIKMALQGSSGSGKTMSALLLAKGIVGDYSKVAIVDSEHGSADLYAHLGDYNVLTLEAPFSPEKYIKAIDVCLKAGMQIVILDSLSHSWEYLLDYHSKMAGNSFTNWSKITPLQNSLVNKILQSPIHFIATMRTKQDYVLNQKDGKFVPEKVGLKAIQRNDIDYEFTLVFDIDIKHNATVSKNRTNLFCSQSEFKISESTGRVISKWCSEGKSLDEIRREIKQCETLEELRSLYSRYPNLKNQILNDVMEQKANIETINVEIIPNSEVINNEPKQGNNGVETS